MHNISNFPEDMFPREYPKIKQQLKQDSVAVPMPIPTLSVVSLMFDDENKDDAIKSPKRLTQSELRNDSQISTKCAAARQPSIPELELTLYESPNSAIENSWSLKEQLESQECQQEIPCNNGNNYARAYYSVHHGQQQIQARKSNVYTVKENSNVSQTSNHRTISNHNACDYRMQVDNCITAQREELFKEQKNSDVKQKSIKTQKRNVHDDTLVGILRDQQQHILIQQKQIWLQHKQNLIQQKQIFALQHKIEELLLEKENVENKSLVSKRATSFTPDDSGNSMRTTRSTRNTYKGRSSIRATNSFGQTTNSSTSRNRKFDDKPASQQEQETLKFTVSAKYMHSSSISKNLSYTSSNKNDVSINELQDEEISFVSHKEGINYCQQGAVSLDTNKATLHRNKMSSHINDQHSVAMSPSAYDYLFRHRLLEDELDEHENFNNI